MQTVLAGMPGPHGNCVQTESAVAVRREPLCSIWQEYASRSETLTRLVDRRRRGTKGKLCPRRSEKYPACADGTNAHCFVKHCMRSRQRTSAEDLLPTCACIVHNHPNAARESRKKAKIATAAAMRPRKVHSSNAPARLCCAYPLHGFSKRSLVLQRRSPHARLQQQHGIRQGICTNSQPCSTR